MRILITCFGAVIIMFLSVISEITILSNNAHQTDTKMALDNALENAAKEYYLYNEISTKEAFEEKFISYFLCSLDSEYKEINIEIDTSDIESGVVKASVDNKYIQITGVENNIICERTVILEEYVN